jgi:hypothetical protein
VVVNPDPRIYRTATRRRWPVHFFANPSPRRDTEISANESSEAAQ